MTGQISDIPILTYHKISARGEVGINTVHPRKFEVQMRYLKDAGYSAITFNDIKNNNIPDKPIIITFDDGYASVHETALPILHALKFRAVVFIISGYIGKENTWDANLAGIRFSHLHLSQIQELFQAGLEIGSHGVTHRALTYLPLDKINFELSESRERLSNLIQDSISTIAYPFGIQNRTIQNLAKDAGYDFGCINLWGVDKIENNFCLKRIPVYGTDSLNSLKRKFCSHKLNKSEIIKLKILSFPAFLTPIYQKYLNKLY
jgi:peptidoglycan/xylan/chitin deacetylase (PgdA/CDA1 family)